MIRQRSLLRAKRIDDIIMFMHGDCREFFIKLDYAGTEKCPQCGGNHTLSQCPRWRVDRWKQSQRPRPRKPRS